MGLLETVMRLLKDRKGAMINIKGVVALFMGVFLFAVLTPISYDQIYNTSVTGWDATTKTVWYLLPLIGVVVVLIAIVGSLSEGGGFVSYRNFIERFRYNYRLAKIMLHIDNKGGLDPARIISLVVVLLVFAILMPVGFGQIFKNFATNRTSWVASGYGSTVISLAKLTPLLTVVAVLIALVYTMTE